MNDKSTNKSKLKKSVKDNPHTSSIINQEADYFLAGPDTETDRAASAKTTLK